VKRAREFIDDNLDQPIGLSDLARAAELPRFRLFRAFVRTVGMPPHAYQRQARVRAAADLIRRGHRLSEVASAAGFADQAHLTRTFRRIMGATPGVYRAAFAGAPRG
jgi:AraC-like DNA-binding protein